MARKKESEKEDNAVPPEETAENQKESDVADKSHLVQEIRPVAYAVRLKNIHPHGSYGRCGYRFNKETDVEIAVGDIRPEQVLILAEDPYLELIPVTEDER